MSQEIQHSFKDGSIITDGAAIVERFEVGLLMGLAEFSPMPDDGVRN